MQSVDKKHIYHIVVDSTYEVDYEEDCSDDCLLSAEEHNNRVQDIAETYGPNSGHIMIPGGLGRWNRTNYVIQVREKLCKN